MAERRGRKKGSKFGVPVPVIYGIWGRLQRGGAPCDPKSNNPMKKEQLKSISMVVDMETEDSLKRRAVMVIAKKIGLACADLFYYRTNNIHFLLCISMVLIYNSELGVIISSEFFSRDDTPEEVLFTP